MADVEDVLRAALRDDNAVAALAGARIYFEVLPENESAPALVINRITTTPVRAMGADSGLVWCRFQIDAFATKEAQARALAKAVRGALPRAGLAGPPVVQAIFFDNENGGFDAVTRRYQRAVDFIVWWEEA